MVAMVSRLMPLEEVAKALGVSVYSVRRFVSRGALKSVRIGARVMVSSDEVVRAQKEGVTARNDVAAQSV
jgi:excisionase family DNA binding protein